MTGSQQDEHDAIQHFLEWRKAERRRGFVSGENPSEAFFLPCTALKAYLSDYRRVHNLFRAVFTEGDPANYPDVTEIQESYLKVFCILLCIKQARFIHLFIRRELDDLHLPLKAKPEGFPESTTPFWNDFYKQQWEFCAPIFKYNMNKDFEPGYVLPVIHHEKLSEGGSGASLYKIVLHESYDKLHPGHRSRLNTPTPKSHTYVLKRYRTKDAEKYYSNEKNGHKRIRNRGRNGNPPSQIIGFYGNFTQRGSYNILMEYADEHTLEDYFKNTPPPSSGQDIVTFWSGLLTGAFEALKIIHIVGQGDAEGEPIFHGWHQDLKPANILVKAYREHDDASQSGIHRRYMSEFKVADLGLSHFRKKVPSAEAADRDARGTRTYGAPECWRDSVTEESTLVVRQNVDVWSLGGVLSEAVVWAISGYHHVVEYRQQREKETEGIDDFDEGDCFHDGSDVLQSVGHAHRSHLEDRRPRDVVTARVVKLIEDGMLVEPEARLNATQLCSHARKIIKEARAELGMDSVDDAQEDAQPQQNVTNPPARYNSRAKQRLSDQSVSSWKGYPNGQGPGGSGIPILERDDNMPGHGRGPNHFRSDDSISTEDSHLGSEKDTGLDDEETGGSRPHSRPKSESPYQQLSPSQSADPTFSNHFPQNHAVAQGKRPIHNHNQNMEHRETLGSLTESQAETVVEAARPTPRTSLPQNNTFPVAPPPGSPARHPSPSSHLPQLNPRPNPLGLQDLRVSRSNIRRTSTSRPPPPSLSVEQAMQWKHDKKKGKSAVLPDRYLLNDLNNRDCAFLIDDAASMKPHWEDVKKCLEILGYIVKETDKDGFEVYFSMNWNFRKIRKLKTAAKLVAEAEARQLEGRSNMKEALGNILLEYKGRLDKTTSSGLFKLKKDVKRLNLYILTDGVWQDHCDIEAIIMEMVRTTKTLGLHNAQIGIQFIQFGNDEEGSRRLEYFDSGLNLDENEDIVDNEPFEGGNVWKMLLGAINKTLDGDPVHKKTATGTNASSSTQSRP